MLHPCSVLKEHPKIVDISHGEIAEILGVTRQTVWNVLEGKTALTPLMAVKLENYLGDVSARDLMITQIDYDLAHAWEKVR